MPTKIVLKPSDFLNGEINKQDLTNIILDFDNLIEINSITSRLVKKVHTVSIPALIIQHLLEKIDASEMSDSNINIKFGVTLPDQKECTDGTTDVSNHLTVVLVIEKNSVELVSENDFVITPGFKEFNPNKASDDRACCPVIHPDN